MPDTPKQKPSGRTGKQVSEPVYPADILSDAAFRRASVAVKGAWFAVLLEMWRTGASTLSGTVGDFAHDWNCDDTQANDIIDTLLSAEIFNVTLCNGTVTLLCRRLKRRETQRQQVKARVHKHRVTLCNDTVTLKKTPPSVSVSSASALSPSPSGGDGEEIRRRIGAFADLVIGIIDARPEFNQVMIPADVAREIHNAKLAGANVEKNVAEFVSDMRNSIELPDSPMRMLRKYLAYEGSKRGGGTAKDEPTVWALTKKMEAKDEQRKELSMLYGFQHRDGREKHQAEWEKHQALKSEIRDLRNRIASMGDQEQQ